MNLVNVFFYLIAFFITVPILATWIAYKIFKKLYKHPLKAFHQSIQWTTFLYIIVVVFLLKIVFTIQVTGYVIVFLLMLMILIIFLQWKVKEEVSFAKAINLLWRISFLIFFGLYCVLIIVGIIRKIFY